MCGCRKPPDLHRWTAIVWANDQRSRVAVSRHPANYYRISLLNRGWRFALSSQLKGPGSGGSFAFHNRHALRRPAHPLQKPPARKSVSEVGETVIAASSAFTSAPFSLTDVRIRCLP